MTLPQRIEAAEGADRLLDFDIAKEVFGRSIGVAKYTASVDAALTLVPEGWTGFVPVRGGDGEEAWLWPVDGTMNKGHRTTAPTPAEALFAAIEKARTV